MRMAPMFVVIVSVTVSGCAATLPSWFDPAVYEASRHEMVAAEELTAMEHELGTAYLEREKSTLQGGGAATEPRRPVAVKNGATVILRNNDVETVHVTVRQVNMPPEIADTWDPVIKPGETFVYPIGDLSAPLFKAGAVYEVVWWRERPGGSYSQSPRIYRGVIKTGIKARWSTQDQLWFFGGYEFLPGPAYE